MSMQNRNVCIFNICLQIRWQKTAETLGISRPSSRFLPGAIASDSPSLDGVLWLLTLFSLEARPCSLGSSFASSPWISPDPSPACSNRPIAPCAASRRRKPLILAAFFAAFLVLASNSSGSFPASTQKPYLSSLSKTSLYSSTCALLSSFGPNILLVKGEPHPEEPWSKLTMLLRIHVSRVHVFAAPVAEVLEILVQHEKGFHCQRKFAQHGQGRRLVLPLLLRSEEGV